MGEAMSDPTPPPNGTRWVWNRHGIHWGDYAMRDGVLRFEMRDGRKPHPVVMTVAELRFWHDLFTEIPPEVTP